MQKPSILFDIDRTIFDTDTMTQQIDDLTIGILGNLPYEEFKKVKNEYKETLSRDREFIPERCVDYLVKHFKTSKRQEILDIYYSPKYSYIYKDNVFSQTYDLFEKLKDKYRLGVYSEGYIKFQKHKLASMGIENYLDKSLIFVVEVKDTEEVLSKIPKKAIIVDDKKIICDYLYEKGFQATWLNKKDDTESDKYKTVHSLLELTSFL